MRRPGHPEGCGGPQALAIVAPWDFIRHQNSHVENGFCGGVAGLRDKEDKRACSKSCPSGPRTPPNRMKVEEAGCQVATLVLRKA